MFRTYPLILQENHYYAYGSAIPKLYTANGRERYTYNGKELIEDFNINLHDYGARQYDPLTARWNGVDALAEQYHTTTGYGYVGGNPISRIDPDGMRTVYVLERNSVTDSDETSFLFISNDNLPDAITVIKKEDIAKFQQKLATSMNKCTEHDNVTNKELRQFGDSYMVESLTDFYDTNIVNIDAKTIEGSSFIKIALNGKTLKGLPAERGVFLYRNYSGNEIWAGSPRSYYTSNSFDGILTEDREKGTVETPYGGQVSFMHLHPSPGEYDVWYNYSQLRLGPTPIFNMAGPSQSDYAAKSLWNKRYYKAVVDNAYIYLYKDSYLTKLTIPKKLFK